MADGLRLRVAEAIRPLLGWDEYPNQARLVAESMANAAVAAVLEHQPVDQQQLADELNRTPPGVVPGDDWEIAGGLLSRYWLIPKGDNGCR